MQINPFKEICKARHLMVNVQLHYVIIICTGILLCNFSNNALAVPKSANLYISARVVPTCEVRDGSVDFGSYLPGEDDQGSGTIMIKCSQGTKYELGIDPGRTDLSNEKGSSLKYKLYKDAKETNPWGDDEGNGGTPYIGTGNGAIQPLTVYGVIPKNQKRDKSGSYVDTDAIELKVLTE